MLGQSLRNMDLEFYYTDIGLLIRRTKNLFSAETSRTLLYSLTAYGPLFSWSR
jgi:hypothetical protein